MLYIMTKEDLALLELLSERESSEKSPLTEKELIAAEEGFDFQRAAQSLKSIALAKEANGETLLSAMGEMLAERLFAPQAVVSIYRTSVDLNGPVDYCFSDGLWAAITVESPTSLRYIFFPMETKDAILHARENLLAGYEVKPGGGFEVFLTLPEAAVFQLSQMLIARRVEEKGGPLEEEEGWFAAPEIFDGDSLELLAYSSAAASKSGLDRELSAALTDLEKATGAFLALVEKGLFESKEVEGKLFFKHSPQARRWLTDDGLLDRVIITGENGMMGYHYFRLEGIVEASQQNGMIVYRTVADLPLESFFFQAESLLQQSQQGGEDSFHPAEAAFYLSREGSLFGPYSWEELKNFAREGLLSPADLISGPNRQEWTQASAYIDLFR